MQFKKNRAILAAVVAAAMATSALMTTVASAAGGVGGEWHAREKDEKYGTDTYAARFLSLYDDVINNGQENGYLSKTNTASGGFGIPYHSIEELICEAPDYGHETTSEAMSYIVWIAAMNDHITKEQAGKIDGVTATSDLAKAWKTLEMMIPEKSQQTGFFGAELSSQVAKEWPEGPENYPSEGNQSNVGKNPIAKDFTSNYSSEGREYLLHWLADVDDWYGFSGSARGTAGKFTFINTFQRGDQESCFETVPHPAIETLEYGNSTQGMKFAFQNSTAKSWSYTNAPDAEDRAIQAVYAANRWGVGNAEVSSKAGMMGDFCRNDMFDKYYKTIGCQSYEADASGGGLDGQHFLMSWYTAWGGAADGTWAWQIGCSHSHQFYQNPLAAYGLLVDSGLKQGMKSSNAAKDYTTSLQRQMELYLWLQSPEGPFAGGCTNSWNGKYEKYPSGVPTFYDMAYIEHPVYADPGSNGWTGNQFWATQRLAELYYVIKTEGDNSGVKPGGLSLEKALETVLDKWVDFFVKTTEFTEDGDYSVVSNIQWTGAPDSWNKTYTEGANKGLKAEVGGTGNSDFGCAANLANTLAYYAKAKGVKPTGTTAEKGSTLAENALYTAQQLLDRLWAIGRDDVGVSRTDHNGSLARVFGQEVYIPSGSSGTYPYGYTVEHGAKFIDIRPMYADLEGYQALKDAYDADVAAGAKMIEDTDNGYGKNNTVDCSQFTNVASVDLTYHRFWHVSDILMGLGTMYELYPELTPTDAEQIQPTLEADWGNVDCSKENSLVERVNVADAVLLARFNAEDEGATVTAQGKLNAQCAWDKSKGEDAQVLDADDLSYLLEYLAGLKKYEEIGNQ